MASTDAAVEPLPRQDLPAEWCSSLQTHYCADSFEWCPHPGPRACTTALCSNYHLFVDSNTKVGRLYAVHVAPGPADPSPPPASALRDTAAQAANVSAYGKEASGGDPERLTEFLGERPTPWSRGGRAPVCHVTDTRDTPAVLDSKWRPHVLLDATDVQDPRSLFASAMEDGTVRIYEMTGLHSSSSSCPSSSSSISASDSGLRGGGEEATTRRIEELVSLPCASPGTLALALDWSSHHSSVVRAAHRAAAARADREGEGEEEEEQEEKEEEEEGEEEPRVTGLIRADADLLVSSFSDGSLVVGHFRAPPGTAAHLLPLHRWRAHDMEAWTAVFDAWDPHRVYSGSDDTTLKLWDLRLLPQLPGSPNIADEESTDGAWEEVVSTLAPRAPPVAVVREHTAGVCAVAPHPHHPFLLASGGYDERVLLWDSRALRTPLASYSIGGGVWRLRWHPEPRLSHTLLVVGMYSGVHVLETNVLRGTAATTDGRVEADSGAAAVTDVAAADWARLRVTVAASPLATGRTVAARPAPDLRRVAHYTHHGPTSIAYGGDWCPTEALGALLPGPVEERPRALIGTCSFYNKRVDLWTLSRETPIPARAIQP